MAPMLELCGNYAFQQRGITRAIPAAYGKKCLRCRYMFYVPRVISAGFSDFVTENHKIIDNTFIIQHLSTKVNLFFIIAGNIYTILTAFADPAEKT